MSRRGPRRSQLPPLPPAILLFLLALLPFLPSSLTALAASPFNPKSSSHASSSPPSTRTPLLMLSTMDGTVSAFDARSGDLLFTHRDDRPAVDSWAAPGMPEYVPGLDGLLYRIDRGTEEAQIIDGRFINTRAAAPSTDVVAEPDGTDPQRPSSKDHQSTSDAVILTAEDSSVLYIDLRTGRLLRKLNFAQNPANEPLLPKMSEHVIVLSRTSVGVRVLDTITGQELANASLVHTTPSFLDHGRCLTTGEGEDDAYVAYVTAARDRVTVKSMTTGELLWSKEISTPVVEAHGLRGVRIAKSRREAEAIGRGEELDAMLPALGDSSNEAISSGAQRHVIVSKDSRYVFATLAGPEGDGTDGDDDDDMLMLSDGRESSTNGNSAGRKKTQRYRISNDVSALSSQDRILGLGRLPRLRQKAKQVKPDDVTFVVTSRDAGLALIALVIVGLVGYKLGSRPRKRETRRRKVRKRKGARVPGDENAAGDDVQTELREKDHDESDTDPDDEDEVDHIEEEERSLPRSKGTGRQPTVQNNNGQRALGIQDPNMEASTGSSGSTGGGFISNRTESGWMTVGCLQVSSKVLGVGSHGTVVYEGKMTPGERKVAVKRLLRQFFESARKEISLLVELDEASPHVVRYFAMEEDSEFIYLALELCAASLAERVTQQAAPVPPPSYRGGPPPHFTSRALRQLLQGLADLHRVGVVHRDVKPQNVLLTRSAASCGDVKLADVGLALRLAANRSSYTAVTNAGGGVGTTGWRAPEVLSGGRQTKAVDIFAAGCVVCFVLTGGNHPFGNAIFGRDGNIAAGKPSLEALEALELPEAQDIVTKMIDPVAANRPCAAEALNHPFFWTDATKLSFLVDISDRLYDTRHDPARYTESLDRSPQARQHCSDWLVRMDMELLMGLGRGYENTASGLLRVIRNKRNHYSELSASLRTRLGELPEDKHRPESAAGPNSSRDSEESASTGKNFLTYFTSKVPHLVMCVYSYAIENPLLIDQSHFSRYGLNADPSREQLALHPLVRKARVSRLAPETPSRLVEMDEHRDSFISEADEERMIRVADDENEPLAVEEASSDEDDVISARKPRRRAYHRHELVALQPLCRNAHPEIQDRLELLELYQSTAYERNRKLLTADLFERTDQAPPPDHEGATAIVDLPPGFTRIIPQRQSQQGSSSASSRNSTYMSSSPTPRPPGFTANGPPGFTGYGPPGFPESSPSRPPGENGPSNSANTALPYPRRGSAPNIAPTKSQFSGEERIVDFGALRRRKR